jgi:hypothetical protein
LFVHARDRSHRILDCEPCETILSLKRRLNVSENLLFPVSKAGHSSPVRFRLSGMRLRAGIYADSRRKNIR